MDEAPSSVFPEDDWLKHQFQVSSSCTPSAHDVHYESGREQNPSSPFSFCHDSNPVADNSPPRFSVDNRSFAHKDVINRQQVTHNGASSKQAWQYIRIFTRDVLLPPNSCICNSVGNLIEVDARGYKFSQEDLDEIRHDHYPHLLVDWIDKATLCFQIPSSSSTNIAFKFELQIQAYLKRYNKTSEIDTRPSSSLFKATSPQSRGMKICADLTIFKLLGYEQKVDASMAHRHTIPDDVQVYATIEVQSYSQSEDEIRDACKKEARLMDCIAIAILVKKGLIEIYDNSRMLHASFNPRFIDIGSYCRSLNGLRLYLDPLRHTKGWRFPPQPSSYCHEENDGSPMPRLISAIQVGDFTLAENIVNYIESLKEEERPLFEAVKQATLQVPHVQAHAFVDYLLKNGACPSQDMKCISAILIATAAKNQRMMDLLKQHGAPAPDIGSDNLVEAVRKCDTEFFSCLILQDQTLISQVPLERLRWWRLSHLWPR